MNRRLRLLLRLVAIQRVMMRHDLDQFVWRIRVFPALRWLRWLRPWRRPTDSSAVRLRRALEDLGPIFVKFGQALSVRPDMLPDDVALELAKLQDRVPPFDSTLAVAVVEAAFGKPIDDVYAHFDRVPIAAASIAQVHAATLHDGRQVVVKLLRPNIDRQIERDVEVLYALANLAHAHWADAQRIRPREVVREFEKTLSYELDLLREAANASQLRRNFSGSELLYVPDVFWDFCRTNVMTMERVSGVPISDTETLRRCGTDMKRLADNGVEIFFTQVFRHNFFHADMHPGNIFVDATNPAMPRYVAVDFGIVGSLDVRDQLYLAENFLAFFRRDYGRVAKLHIDSGWVPADTRADELEAAIRAVCEPIFARPLKDISFGLVLMRLFATARKFQMPVQPQLVLLQKTLLAVEGLGRKLYPELDLWKTAFPILEDWMRERRDPRRQLRRLIAAWPEIGEDLALLPQLLHRAIRRADRPVETSTRVGPHTGAQRNRSVLPSAALIVTGTVWTGFAAQPSWLGWAAVALGIVVLLWRAR